MKRSVLNPADFLRELSKDDLVRVHVALGNLIRDFASGEQDHQLLELLIGLHGQACAELICRSFPEAWRPAVFATWRRQGTN